MKTFSLNCRVGFNHPTKTFVVDVSVSNIDTLDDAKKIASMLAKSFQDHFQAKGAVIERSERDLMPPLIIPGS